MSKLLVVLVVCACATLVAATEWMEPQYTDAAEVEPALIEEGGVPVTVGGRKGMVTYISPARHVQSSGIVFTPAPHMQIESNVDPRLGGIINPVTGQRVYTQPLYVQPIYRPYRLYGDVVAAGAEFEPRSSRSSRSRARSMAERNAGSGPIVTPDGKVMTPIPNELTVDEIINAPFRSPKGVGAHFGHRHQRRHRNHKHARGDLAVALANARRGITSGSGAIEASIARAADSGANIRSVVSNYHTYSPEAVPVSLLNHPAHLSHYDHKSDSVSNGIITVPHSERDGKITLEAAEYVGYNAGPHYQLDSVPTGHFSDGSAYPASINQRFN